MFNSDLCMKISMNKIWFNSVIKKLSILNKVKINSYFFNR